MTLNIRWFLVIKYQAFNEAWVSPSSSGPYSIESLAFCYNKSSRAWLVIQKWLFAQICQESLKSYVRYVFLLTIHKYSWMTKLLDMYTWHCNPGISKTRSSVHAFICWLYPWCNVYINAHVYRIALQAIGPQTERDTSMKQSLSVYSP